ncbi:hypothetical protein HKX48_006570 [Thoreauomyces humboldtii]|nr:hypothetical protein HKX48_006570 [Thoreauomyces humboldtii]
MNKDEALRCLQISKQKYKAGDPAAAAKFAKKAQALCETDEGAAWLSFCATLDTRNPQPTTAKQRPTSADRRASESDVPTRPFTPDQVAGIRRIKACKGDLYEVLGLERGCGDGEIKKAYRKLALQFHPDKCGAPGTDDAFKAIGHAFNVLGDVTKRSKYDRFGVDSDNPRSGGGGGGGGGFAGFGGPQFESEISPEDVFNMFFGDMGGPGAFFPHDGGFIHLLPLLALFLLPLLSGLFSSATDSRDPQPTFAFSRSQSHAMDRRTAQRSVPYFVDGKAWARWKAPATNPDDVRKYEAQVEHEWHRNLQHLCAQEQERRQKKIADATGWLKSDSDRLKKAQNMPMHNCDRLRNWN